MASSVSLRRRYICGHEVFDLTRIMRMSHTNEKSRIGVDGARTDAHGYQYIVPQVATYRLSESSCPLKFSAIALDEAAHRLRFYLQNIDGAIFKRVGALAG